MVGRDGDAVTISITIFNSTADRSPRREESLDWGSFEALFTDHRLCACTRRTCPGRGCSYKQGACWAASSTRSQLLVLDVDGLSEDAFVAQKQRLSRFQHLLHSTHSDRLESRSVRIVILLSRLVTRAEWPTLWRACLPIAPGADAACADFGRRYFFPSCPSDATWFRHVHTGEALDVDATLAGALTNTPTTEAAL